MARENQGLQIAVIVFVMLTIILGVTTFIFYRQYEEAAMKADKAQQDASSEMTKSRTIQEENNDLKALMGFAATMNLEEIKAQHTEDMNTYASTFPEETQFYHPILEQLAQAKEDKDSELVDLKAALADLQLKYEKREEIMAPQIAQHEQARQQAAADLVKATTSYKLERDRITKDQAETAALLDKARKESGAAMAAVESKLDVATKKLIDTVGLLGQKSEKLEAISKETFAAPDGEVRWVNQQDGTVWINLGRADALSRQVTFSVYPIDTTNLTRGGKKASIEVTQILGDHLAEARVLEDNVSDPIMPGDKIHTPIWSVGETKRFALAGFFDIDDDGKSDQHTVRNLITMNGGTVDCETNNKTGEAQGPITVNTRYLVLGNAPDVKSKAGLNPGAVQAAVKAYSDMRTEAERLGVQVITVAELLQNMGWKNQTPVIRFGRDANPNDFRAKAEDGAPKVSTGTVSGLFEPRRPASERGNATRRGAY